VVEPDDAARIVDRWRREEGVSVALANGCFDLLHVGHIRYLRGAAAEADRLVVGVNADAAVAASKGAGRPILDAAGRAALVAAVAGVDLVTVFGEATADELIARIEPDVHCKGTDYTGGVPEAETVRLHGGRVAIVGDPKRHGTRQLVRRIRDIS
jgi:rfaE bifunctional protein nucleotidyltransferase chain/domain